MVDLRLMLPELILFVWAMMMLMYGVIRKNVGGNTMIYLAMLGDRQGPKVGWFLASLDRDFVKTRLKEAAAS